LGAEIFQLQLVQRIHQGLGHESSAIRAKVAEGVRKIFCDNGNHWDKDNV